VVKPSIMVFEFALVMINRIDWFLLCRRSVSCEHDAMSARAPIGPLRSPSYGGHSSSQDRHNLIVRISGYSPPT